MSNENVVTFKELPIGEAFRFWPPNLEAGIYWKIATGTYGWMSPSGNRYTYRVKRLSAKVVKVEGKGKGWFEK